MSYVKFKINANGDPRLNCPKTIVADYPIVGAPALLFTKSAWRTHRVHGFRVVRVIVKSSYLLATFARMKIHNLL